MSSGIYSIQNVIDNKRYIGASTNICKRKWSHFNQLERNIHTNTHLQHAFNKFGKDNFVFDILCEIDKNDIVKIDEMERHYISFYQTLDEKHGYNLMEGGKHPVLTKEHREKLSQSHKGLTHSEETKRKISENSAKPHMTKEQKDRLKKKCSENNARYWEGKKMPDSIKGNMSKNNSRYWKGKKIPQSAINKCKETKNSKTVEEKMEINRRISETVKRKWIEGAYDSRNKKSKK